MRNCTSFFRVVYIKRIAAFLVNIQRKITEKRRTAYSCPPQETRILLIIFDVLNDRADSLQILNFAVRNFNTEFVFKAHDQIDNSQGICIQVVNQIGILVDDGRIDAELIGKNFNDFLRTILLSSYI